MAMLGGLTGRLAKLVEQRMYSLTIPERAAARQRAIQDFEAAIDAGDGFAHTQPSKALYQSFIRSIEAILQDRGRTF